MKHSNPTILASLGLSLLLGSIPWCTASGQEAPRVEAMTETRPLDRVIIRHTALLTGEQHVLRRPFDDEISARSFDLFLGSIDPLKLYLLQEDVDAMMASRNQLDDLAMAGDMSFAIAAFKTFLKRADEHIAWAHEEIDRDHDFSIDEYWEANRAEVPYPKDQAEARDRIRRRIKNQLLLLEKEQLDLTQNRPETKDAGANLATNGTTTTSSDDSTASVPASAEGRKEPVKSSRERLHRRYSEALKQWHELDADGLLEMYLSALTMSIDPHTSYMSARTLGEFKILMGLNLVGIGAELSTEEGYPVLTRIIRGGPADKDGRLRAGDRIVKVGQGEDGEMIDVADRKAAYVVDMVRGKAGTTVRLAILPVSGGDIQMISITRGTVELESSTARGEVFSHGRKADGTPYKVGYIDLPSFYLDVEATLNGTTSTRGTTRDMRNLLEGFKAQNIDAVVVDLSRNGGGSLEEVINTAGLFIDHGPVVQVKDSQGEVTVHEDYESGTAWNGPLIVLTSKESASASEVFAGTMQAYKRGVVVGDPETHGKGTVQSVVDLAITMFKSAGTVGALKITIQQFYLPDGRSTQLQGVSSDIVIPSLTADLPGGEAELKYAVASDSIPTATFVETPFVTRELLSKLKMKSEERVRNEPNFTKLASRVNAYRQSKKISLIPLERQKFQKYAEQMDLADTVNGDALDMEKLLHTQKIPDYYREEVLNIACDLVEQGQQQKE